MRGNNNDPRSTLIHEREAVLSNRELFLFFLRRKDPDILNAIYETAELFLTAASLSNPPSNVLIDSSVTNTLSGSSSSHSSTFFQPHSTSEPGQKRRRIQKERVPNTENLPNDYAHSLLLINTWSNQDRLRHGNSSNFTFTFDNTTNTYTLNTMAITWHDDKYLDVDGKPTTKDHKSSLIQGLKKKFPDFNLESYNKRILISAENYFKWVAFFVATNSSYLPTQDRFVNSLLFLEGEDLYELRRTTLALYYHVQQHLPDYNLTVPPDMQKPDAANVLIVNERYDHHSKKYSVTINLPPKLIQTLKPSSPEYIPSTLQGPHSDGSPQI